MTAVEHCSHEDHLDLRNNSHVQAGCCSIASQHIATISTLQQAVEKQSDLSGL
jgi:hypothetical protein